MTKKPEPIQKTYICCLRPHQEKLQHLAELAGISMDKKVFRLLIELLNLGYGPNTVYNLLKMMRKSRHSKSRRSLVSAHKAP